MRFPDGFDYFELPLRAHIVPLPHEIKFLEDPDIAQAATSPLEAALELEMADYTFDEKLGFWVCDRTEEFDIARSSPLWYLEYGSFAVAAGVPGNDGLSRFRGRISVEIQNEVGRALGVIE